MVLTLARLLSLQVSRVKVLEGFQSAPSLAEVHGIVFSLNLPNTLQKVGHSASRRTMYSMWPSTNILEFSHAYCRIAHGRHALARQGLQGGMLNTELPKTRRLPHGCQGPFLCAAHNTAQAHV